MIITFSQHARQMLRERKLTQAVIKKVMKKPDEILERSDGTKIAQRQIRWHDKEVLCRVVYRLTSREAARIITAYVTTKIKKYK